MFTRSDSDPNGLPWKIALVEAYIRYMAVGRVLPIRQIPLASKVDRRLRALVRRTLGIIGTGSDELFVDRLDSLSLRSASYEPFESEVLDRLIRPGDSVVDVGANIGYYTLRFARAVGPTGRVFAFEPESENHRLLSRSLRLNGYKNVVIAPYAVAEAPGDQKLYLATRNLGDHRTFDFYGDRQGVTVRKISLDGYFPPNANISVIKMDIQGGEWNALVGMEDLLRHRHDVILLTEYSPRLLKEFGIDPSMFPARLEALGFKLYDLQEKARRIVPVDTESLATAFEKETRLEGEDYTNLICVRGQLPESLSDLKG